MIYPTDPKLNKNMSSPFKHPTPGQDTTTPPKPENPLVARVMRLTDNDAMDLCQSFNVSPKGTKFLTAKAVVDRVTAYGIPDVVDLFTRELEKAEKRTPPEEKSDEYGPWLGGPRVSILSKEELFGLMSRMFGVEPPKPKRLRIEYETDLLSSPETVQRIIEEQSRLNGCPAYNIKVTEVE